jgi:hypothetical protein
MVGKSCFIALAANKKASDCSQTTAACHQPKQNFCRPHQTFTSGALSLAHRSTIFRHIMKKRLLPVVALALLTVPAWAAPGHPVAEKPSINQSVMLPNVEVDGKRPHHPKGTHHSLFHKNKTSTKQ